jgi:hypothetical protein
MSSTGDATKVLVMVLPAVLEELSEVGENGVAIFGEALKVGVVAGHIGLELGGMFEHPRSFQDDFALDDEVAALAEGDEVPPGGVGGVQVEVVDGECVAGRYIMWVTTADALPVGGGLDLVCDGWPIGGIGVEAAAGHGVTLVLCGCIRF